MKSPISHPGIRLIDAMLLIVAPLFLRTPAAALFVLCYLAVFIACSRIPPGRIVEAARNISIFILLVLVLNILFAGGDEHRLVSHRGVRAGVLSGARILIVYYAAVAFTLVTSQDELARGLAALVGPFSESAAKRIALFGFLSFRFFGVFSDEIRRIAIVQRFRGGGTGGGLLGRLRGVPSILIPLMISAIRRSSQLAMAVELRDLKQAIGGLLVLEKPGIGDYVWTAATAGVLVAALAGMNG
jgi:energy-coupling factor transport system permease protein